MNSVQVCQIPSINHKDTEQKRQAQDQPQQRTAQREDGDGILNLRFVILPHPCLLVPYIELAFCSIAISS